MTRRRAPSRGGGIASAVTLRQPSRVGTWASRARWALWRVVCWLLGGLTVAGELPRQRAYVVVANHGSHADTAALLAALPPASRPVFAAAAGSRPSASPVCSR